MAPMATPFKFNYQADDDLELDRARAFFDEVDDRHTPLISSVEDSGDEAVIHEGPLRRGGDPFLPQMAVSSNDEQVST